MLRAFMRWPFVSLVVLLLGASGCYRAHSTGEAGVADAGRGETGSSPDDARADVRFDTSVVGECRTDDDCPAPVVSCARAVCFGRGCGVEEIPGACTVDMICDLERGCVTNPDFRDGGSDAGPLPDVGTRDAAPFDAGFVDAFVVPPDAALFDAGLPDAWAPDAFVEDAGPLPTSSAIRCTPETVLRVPHHAQLDFGPAGTLELWVRARAPGIIAMKGSASGGHVFTLRIEGTGDDATILGGWGSGADESMVVAPFGAQMGRWAHVALVQRDLGDTVEISLVIDGVLVSTATVIDDFTSVTNSLDLRICTLDADVDEIRLWRVARDETSIVADLRRMLPSGIMALSAYWPLEERGQIVLDRSFHGAEGVLGETTDVERVDPIRIRDGAF